MSLVNKNWGISLVNRRPPALDESLELKRVLEFCAVELPGSMLGKLEVTTALTGKRPEILSFGRLLDSALTRQAAELEGSLKLNFEEHFYTQAKLAHSLNAWMVGADFDMEKAALNSDYHRKAGSIIRTLCAPWFYSGMRIALPVRIPLPSGNGKEAAEQIVAALGRWMMPEVGLILEVHIHELQIDDELKHVLNTFKYNTTMLRIIYEPEVGNLLAAPVLSRFMELLHPLLAQVPLLLSPVHMQNETLSSQLDYLPELINAVRLQRGE